MPRQLWDLMTPAQIQALIQERQNRALESVMSVRIETCQRLRDIREFGKNEREEAFIEAKTEFIYNESRARQDKIQRTMYDAEAEELKEASKECICVESRRRVYEIERFENNELKQYNLEAKEVKNIKVDCVQFESRKRLDEIEILRTVECKSQDFLSQAMHESRLAALEDERTQQLELAKEESKVRQKCVEKERQERIKLVKELMWEKHKAELKMMKDESAAREKETAKRRAKLMREEGEGGENQGY